MQAQRGRDHGSDEYSGRAARQRPARRVQRSCELISEKTAAARERETSEVTGPVRVSPAVAPALSERVGETSRAVS